MTIIDKAASEIIVFDDVKPEANAMMLALYSRSPQSVNVHRKRVAEVGADKFMDQYYVGYGHKSIGDCGSTTICCENISMLAAKAVQDSRLYNGQEASTRYLPMAEQPVLNPLGTEEGSHIQEAWMNLYSHALEVLIPFLKDKYPIEPSDKPAQYEKAIKARAFDIARSFLPAGCTTYVGWHTNLRQAWDHVKEMMFHPLPEVRSLARYILSELQNKYPSSFNFKSYLEQDAYYDTCSDVVYEDMKLEDDFSFTHTLDVKKIWYDATSSRLLATRPVKTELPKRFERYGQIQFRFYLDFGSFRDIQRHRSCTQVMPLLTIWRGFNSWYLDALPDELRKTAEATIQEQMQEISKIEDPHMRQYYIAMGFNVACELTASLPSAIYIAELRSDLSVHPTLRPIAQKMGQALKSILPDMAIHCDNSLDKWTTVRGKHDIVKK